MKWSPRGVERGELVFVSGNPGRTSRISTVAALKYQRDVRLPFTLNFIRRREIMLQQFGLKSPEKERRAHDDLFGVQNSRKALSGMLQGLQDPEFLATKRAAESRLLTAVRGNTQLQDHVRAWETIERCRRRRAELLGKGVSLNMTLFRTAQTLVRMAVEDKKPSAERLREFRDSAPSLSCSNCFRLPRCTRTWSRPSWPTCWG